jgi:hypothetical protein
MRQTLNSISDRMLSAFVPKAKAGACACFPSDGSWSERRCYKGQYDQRRTCHYGCLCNIVCTAWADAGDC